LADLRRPLRAVPSEPLGVLLRRRRRAERLTQAQLGAKFGVRQQTIGAWEHGDRPQNRFFSKLAEYLDLDEQELVLLVGEPTGESAESNDETMRMLARRFVEDLESGSLPAAKAADIYRNLTEYFRDRA